VRLIPQEAPGWPRLAWLARCGEHIELRHGPGVETELDWAFEGAWTGAFDDGEFDRVSVATGSGVRIRDGEAVFVSPTSTIDRLWHLEMRRGEALVSNSLLALLEESDAEVTDPRYRAASTSIVRGIDRCRDEIETSAGRVGLTHFRNLGWSGGALMRRDKAPVGETFTDFGSYRSFLARTFESLSQNMNDTSRNLPLSFLGTVSSGYDANACTALAGEVGCRSAIAFLTTGRGRPDNGVPVAEKLGIEPIVLERSAWRLAPPGAEVPFLAAGGGSGLIEFHAAHEHLRCTALVTGFYGDSIWNPDWAELGPGIARKDASGLGLCEYRLRAGFVNCAPAFWAAREVRDIVALAGSAEMAPWRLGEGYDRPVPRRILEEAGVSRPVFGRAKRGVPKAQPHRDARFLREPERSAYFAWLRQNREALGSPRLVSPAVDRATFTQNAFAFRAHVALGRLPGLSASGWWDKRLRKLKRRRRRPTPLRRHVVAWALHRGKEAYARSH